MLQMKIIAFILFVVSQLADAYTTYKALTFANATEANPLLKPLMNKIGVIPALVIFKGLAVIIIGLILWYINSIYVQIATVFVSLGYGYVVYNNYRIFRRDNNTPD